jgi:ABC-type lipoprotein release transport system permease subunit
VLGIALGVAMLISVVLVNRSILRSFAETLDDISGKADLEVTAAASYEEEKLEGIRAVPGVTARHARRAGDGAVAPPAGPRASGCSSSGSTSSARTTSTSAATTPPR